MSERPNVIHIYADDLGRGMLSCYGQKQFRTPNIDRIAAGGIRFDRAYSCVLCAPARASLLNGRHDCHAGAWTFTKGNVYTMISSGRMTFEEVREVINNTGIQAGPDDVFLAQLFKQAGYATGEIGKLEWGFATTPERMERHGWTTTTVTTTTADAMASTRHSCSRTACASTFLETLTPTAPNIHRTTLLRLVPSVTTLPARPSTHRTSSTRRSSPSFGITATQPQNS